MAAMRRAGLPESALTACTFDRWQTPERWQEHALETAKRYVANFNDPNFLGWFMMSGRPGCGKTLLCSAVFLEILKQGRRGRYIGWRDFSREVKAVANDRDAFRSLVDGVKKAEILYLDDLWKGHISPADVSLTFEVLNSRYSDGKPTVISSEHTIESIIRGDEAIGSRIFERSKDFYLDLSRAKNWRLRENPA